MQSHNILPAVGFLFLYLFTALNAEDVPPSCGDANEAIVHQTEAIGVKLNLLEARLKHFLKRNNSHSDIEKLRKYIFHTTMGIKLDLSKLVQNYSELSKKNEDEELSLSYNQTEGPNRPHNLYRMCKHIVESNVCQQMEENQNKLEMTRLLRVADHLINIKTRFRIYAAIYNDMMQKHYDNIYNLNAFLNMLVYHFVTNSNTPVDVIEDAKALRDTIGKTFKQNAVQEIIDHILNYCPSREIDAVLWQLAATAGATQEFNSIMEEAINATYNTVGAVVLLDRGLGGRKAQVACQFAKAVFQHVKVNGELYDTTINFKLVQLIEKALNDTYATLEELEPCFDVERQLNPSVREIVLAGYGCVQNQLHRTFMTPVKAGSMDDNKNRTVFVMGNDEESEDVKWNFEAANGLNQYWIQNRKTKEYLYTPEASVKQSDNIKVSSRQGKEKKNRWTFELIPENGGLRILNEEKRYFYVTREVLAGNGNKHLVAVWQKEGVPPGSVWAITQC